METEDTEALSW